MTNVKKVLKGSQYDATDDYVAEAEGVSLQRIDEAAAVAEPVEIEGTWVGKEYDGYSDEQPDLWAGQGEKQARPFSVSARGLDAAASGYEHMVEMAKGKYDVAVTNAITVMSVLFRFTRREPGAKVWYILRWAVLLLGDIAGISGAAIMRGEIVSLAIAQAISAAMAAVTSGLIGMDIRDIVLARRRKKDLQKLTDEEKPFEHLFQGVHEGERIIKLMVWVAITIMLFIAGGIFALRASVDGTSGGLIFGFLAGAICLASGMNTYVYTDEIADLITSADRKAEKEAKTFEKIITKSALSKRAAMDEQAHSIKREHASRGKAAATKFKALKHRVYRQNPGVVGHGPASSKPAVQYGLFEPELVHSNGINGKAGG